MNSLKLISTKPKVLKGIHLPIRNAQVQEAMSFPISDDPSQKIYTTVYKFQGYELKVGKPGKEFFSSTCKYKDGHKGNNPSDMSPTTYLQGKIVNRLGTFEEVFRKFIMFVPDYDALQTIGALCVRNAMVLDHSKDENGNWRYSPPTDVMNAIKLPKNFGEPLEVFLYYLELIALNEDTKYFTLGYDISSGIGRYNNLMTYAHLINIILHRKNLPEVEFLVELIKFSGGLVRPPAGLNPISLKAALAAYPQLAP